MFFDWILREGGAILSWWLLTLLAGVAVYPLLFRLMGGLPSRGYPLARAAGLMLVGFVFWILGVLGLLWNTPGSTFLAALIVFAVGVVGYVTWREREPILPWLRENRSLIITTEILFAVMFVGWCIVRALNPNLSGTEKPMEMAFLSAIRRSATFPPNDPWMSGYAISYYHFGYIIMGALGNLSGVSNGVAFNLALPLLFALTGIGAFGVAYDLVMARIQSRQPFPEAPADKRKRRRKALADSDPRRSYRQALAAGVMAALFAVVMGNLGTALVEIPYQTCTASPAYLHWMAVEERDAYPNASGGADCGASKSGIPNTWRDWWWFRWSRVVRDYDLGGNPLGVQPITEFPQFSFVLSDMHPHVLALPFATLAIGLCANLVMRKRRLYPWEFFLYAIFVGGMVFLNSWDAVYIVLLVGAEALRRLIANGTARLTRDDVRGLIVFGVSMLVLTGILYSPFFISFRSQVQGIVPNIIWPTQFQQFFLMFGPFIVILGVYLAVEAWRAGPGLNVDFATQVVTGTIIVLVLGFVALMVIAWIKPDLRGAAFQTIDQSGGLWSSIVAVFARRIQGFLTEGVLLAALFVVIARLFAREPHGVTGTPGQARQVITYSPASGFALLLIAAGAVLTLVPDFAYLQDGFGVRINTVFKLYYQGWLLWSIASAFALWSVLSEVAPVFEWRAQAGDDGEISFVEQRVVGERIAPGAVRRVFRVVVTILVLMGMIYPVYAIYGRAIKESDRSGDMTLDGGPSLAAGPDDYKVIQCLAQVAHSEKDVVAEATQPNIAYNITGNYGRVSGLTGIPTLMGWDNHERQWRGSTFDTLNVYHGDNGEPGETRQSAIARLYNTTNWDDVKTIIQRYGITYIYVGPTERRDFNQSGIAKFDGLTPVCASGTVAAYSADAIGAQPSTTAG